MIPICFFPTQVLLIDDDMDFISSLENMLEVKGATYKKFTSPRKALEYINSEANILSVDNGFLEKKESYEFGKESFYLNFSAIKNIALNANRFGDLSVVIVDYNMPNMNGLEFLQEIRNKDIKKILLTGEANEHTAIEAFNQGIIDKFIRKQDFELLKKVNEGVYLLQKRAFEEMSQKMLTASLSRESNPIFQDIEELERDFAKMLKEHRIYEYYLADSQGAYLLLDKEGKASGYFIRTEEHFQVLENEILGEAEISQQIKKKIKAREVMLCYLPTKEKIFPDDDEIKDYLYPAHKVIHNDKEIYCAYTPEFLFSEPIVFPSFKEYLSNH